MKLPINLLIFIVFCLMLLLSGCSIRPKASALHDLGFPFGMPPTDSNSASLTQPAVTVEAPKWLEDTRIHYRLLFATPSQIRFYAMDRWIASPSELFEQLLNHNGKTWPMPLMIQLLAFEQQFKKTDEAKAILYFTVTTVPDEHQQKSFKREFRLQMPSPSPDAKGAVAAFNTLARQAADHIQAWLLTVN